jgi:hypothetical protein
MPWLVAALAAALAVYWTAGLSRFVASFILWNAFTWLALAAAGAWAIVIWRRAGLATAAAAAFALLGGLTGLFWPALEFLFQGVDGGGMPLREDLRHVAVILSYLAVIAASLLVARNAARARTLLMAATAAIVIAAGLAPSSPPSAQKIAVIGLPFVVAAAIVATALAAAGRVKA